MGGAVVLALVLSAGPGHPRRTYLARPGRARVPARAPGPISPPAPGPVLPAGARPVVGIDENNPSLLWSAASGHAAPAFAPFRDALLAIHPGLVRLVIDWARLQPAAGRPPDWGQPTDGCLRGLPPCAPYAGVRDELRAIASLQRGGQDIQPLITVAEVPAWAARPPGGCERPGTTAASRPLNRAGVAGYTALIASLVAEASADGAQVPWWSPWNEPNHPAFISPQRAGCTATAPNRSAATYARIVQAMQAGLAGDPQPHALVLGELADLLVSGPRSTAIGQFVAELPDRLLCRARAWSVHDYPGARPPARTQAIAALEAALNLRGGCAAHAPVWVTETGAGTGDTVAQTAGAGEPSAAGRARSAPERTACRVLAQALSAWARDPRVAAVVQYTFREDTAFPVGLADAALTDLLPSYWLLRAWSRRPAGAPPPPLPSQCRG